MAYIKKTKGRQVKNPLYAEVSGRIGPFVVKQYKDKTVLANLPNMTGIKPSVKQKKERSLFQEAVAFAKLVLKDPKRKAAYAKKLKGKRNVFQAALSEYLKEEKKKAI